MDVKATALLLLLALLMAAGPLRAQEEPLTPSPELQELYDADQADRKFFEGSAMPKPEEWRTIQAHDKKRRESVTELLKGEVLRRAEDFFNAAMIFQHGDRPEDYLTAHILATVAALKGHPSGPWLSAAALDRYLLAKQAPQVFNTQFVVDGSGVWQLRPHEALVPDPVVREFGAKTVKEAEQFLREFSVPSTSSR